MAARTIDPARHRGHTAAADAFGRARRAVRGVASGWVPSSRRAAPGAAIDSFSFARRAVRGVASSTRVDRRVGPRRFGSAPY
jgi:hypothetical protein